MKQQHRVPNSTTDIVKYQKSNSLWLTLYTNFFFWMSQLTGIVPIFWYNEAYASRARMQNPDGITQAANS